MSLLWAAALWVSAYLAGRRRLGLRADEAWLYGGLLFFSEAVATSMILGLSGHLRTLPLACFCAAILAVHIRLASLAAARAPRKEVPSQRWLLIGAAVFAAVGGLRLFIAMVAPPDSWDGLSYHLPIAVRWVLQGNLDLAGWYGTERYYAWNGELLVAWLAVLDRGSLFFAKISQAFVLPLIAACGAALGRRLAGPRWAGACALGLAAVPILLIQAGVPYVDLLYSAFFFAAAAAGTAYLRSGRPVHLLAGATAFGLALGAKSTIYYTAILLAAPALAFYLKPGRRAEMLRLLPVCAAIVMALGFAPYLRNWLKTGNPIFPFAVKLGRHVLFRGPLTPKDLLVSMENWFVSSPRQWLWYPLHERIKGVAEYTYENGFGPLFAAGWLLWPLTFWAALRRRDWAAVSFLSLLPASAFLFMVLQPVRAPRYITFAVCVPIITVACALKRARGLQLLAARALWTAGIVWGMLGVTAYLGQSDGPRAAWRCLRVGWPLSEANYYRRVFYSLGDAWVALNAKIQPGEVVAVNYAELLLPWMGFPPRARAVVLHSERSVYPESYYGLRESDWLGELQAIGARYLVVWSPRWYPQQGEIERAWVAANPGRFKLFGHWESRPMGRTDIYEVMKP